MSKASKAKAEREMKKARMRARSAREEAKKDLQRAKSVGSIGRHARDYKQNAQIQMAEARRWDKQAKGYEKQSKSLMSRILGGK